MSETHATTAVFPPGRYGRRREGGRRRWLPLLFTAVFGAALLALTIGYYNKFGQTDYDPQIIGWNEPSDTRMVVNFKVRVPAGGTATCVVRARDYDGFEVGRSTATIPGPADGGLVEHSETVTTKSRASVGDVMGCRAG